PPSNGNTWNVVGSGIATMSDSCTRANPSIADPSNPIPSSNAASSSAGATLTDFNVPSTSVNHNRTKRMSRSSSVRSTNSCWRSMRAGYAHGEELSVTAQWSAPYDDEMRLVAPLAALIMSLLIALVTACGSTGLTANPPQ